MDFLSDSRGICLSRWACSRLHLLSSTESRSSSLTFDWFYDRRWTGHYWISELIFDDWFLEVFNVYCLLMIEAMSTNFTVPINTVHFIEVVNHNCRLWIPVVVVVVIWRHSMKSVVAWSMLLINCQNYVLSMTVKERRRFAAMLFFRF